VLRATTACTFSTSHHEHSSDIPSQEEEEAEPSCALRGTRNALRRGSSAAWGLLLGYDYLLHAACSAHLSLVDKTLIIHLCCLPRLKPK